MSEFKVGDECKIKSINSGAVFHDCKILYIDNRSIVFSSSASSSSPMSLDDIEFLPLKTPAEIERDDIIRLAIKTSKKANPDLIITTNGEKMLGSLYDAGILGKQQVNPLNLAKFVAIRLESATVQVNYQQLLDGGFIIQGGE